MIAIIDSAAVLVTCFQQGPDRRRGDLLASRTVL